MRIQLRSRTGYALIAALLTIIAVTTYITTRDGCHSYATSRPEPMNGERLVLPSGKTVYWNGDCWTTKKQPPTGLSAIESRP